MKPCNLAMLLIGLFAASVAGASPSFPTAPRHQFYLQDNAGIVKEADRRAIHSMMERAYKDHDTSIVIITINSMGEYDAESLPFERFTAHLFDHWKTQKRTPDGLSIDDGLMLIVSMRDGKLRIELGDEWSRRWDSHCQEVISNSIVPPFKEGDFSEGIREGARELLAMAEKGPRSPPASNPLLGWYARFFREKGLDKVCFFPPHVSFLLVTIGVFCLGAAPFLRPSRGVLILSGIGLGALGTFSYVSFVAFAMILPYFLGVGPYHGVFGFGGGRLGGISLTDGNDGW